MIIKAGEFKISVDEPYPVNCTLYHRGKMLTTFSHREISDLDYALKKARQLARERLGERYRDEVL